MTTESHDILGPILKVMKCTGGVLIVFLAESSGKFCILFSHRILHEQEGPLSLDKPVPLLHHLMDALLTSLDSTLYPDTGMTDTHDTEWFLSQDEALSAARKMWVK